VKSILNELIGEGYALSSYSFGYEGIKSNDIDKAVARIKRNERGYLSFTKGNSQKVILIIKCNGIEICHVMSDNNEAVK